MAKEDFCYTYYDGDAARDKAHMNRLERGAYDDIISAQRKRGRLSIDDIRKVLSGDFEACWPSMEWIMIKDDDGKFFIEWVEKSLEKSRANSQINKTRIKKYWDKVNKENKEKPYQTDTVELPRNNDGIKLEEPLGDGFGDISLNSLEGAETFLIPEMQKKFKAHNPAYPPSKQKDFKPLLEIANFLSEQGGLRGSPEENRTEIVAAWEKVCITVSKDNFYSTKSLSTISNHIQELIQKTVNGTAIKTPGTNYNRKDAGAHVLLELVRAEHDAGRK